MNHHTILTPKGERYVAENGHVIVAFRLRDPLMVIHAITERDVRIAVESEIDRLIALLDAFDDDDELEADADFESSLGGAEISGQVDLEEDQADLEPDDEDQGIEDASHDSEPSVISGGGSGI